MDARQYFLQHGEATCTKVAKAAGTNWEYFRQFFYAGRKPSPKLAKKLVEASVKITPQEPLTFEKLLFPPAFPSRSERARSTRRQAA